MNRLQISVAAVLSVLAVAACGSPAASERGPLDGDGASPAPNAAASVTTAASLELPGVETDFPSACDVLTASELKGIVNNDLSDGAGPGFVCDWRSSAEETGVSLLLQPVPPQFCEQGLPGSATDRFGPPGSVEYSDAGNIPGAQAGVCLDPGLVLVTVTGGYGAESDEARYTDIAVKVMELVLERL
jgi:hypothetical protein